jgi:hypothetical protein
MHLIISEAEQDPPLEEEEEEEEDQDPSLEEEEGGEAHNQGVWIVIRYARNLIDLRQNMLISQSNISRQQ